MSLGNFPPLEFYETVWEERCYFFSEYFIKFTCEAIQSMAFVCWEFLITASILVGVFCLFRFSESSWFNLRRLYISRNLTISSRLSSFLAYNFHNIFLQSFVFLWCQLFYFFPLLFQIFLFGSSLFFSWWVWLKVCQSSLSFQRTNSYIHWYFVSFFRFYFVYFCSDLYYFLISSGSWSLAELGNWESGCWGVGKGEAPFRLRGSWEEWHFTRLIP